MGPQGPAGANGVATADANGTIILVGGTSIRNDQCEFFHPLTPGVHLGDFVVINGPDGDAGWIVTVVASEPNSTLLRVCNFTRGIADPGGLKIVWASFTPAVKRSGR